MPAEAAEAVVPRRASGVDRIVYRLVAGRSAGGHQVRRAVFRASRVADLVRYVTPGSAYIRLRYGCAGAAMTGVWSVLHPFVAVGELLWNAFDYARCAGRRSKPSRNCE